jgi:hypothetical protein
MVSGASFAFLNAVSVMLVFPNSEVLENNGLSKTKDDPA